MGHLHENFLKKFSHLGGPLAYPGSIELTTSEGIKETKKDFMKLIFHQKKQNHRGLN